jgi:hypothetical protein
LHFFLLVFPIFLVLITRLLFCSSLSPITSFLVVLLVHYMLIYLFITYMFVIYLCHLFVVCHHSLFTCATSVAYSLHAYIICSSPTCILLKYPTKLVVFGSLLSSMWPTKAQVVFH